MLESTVESGFAREAASQSSHDNADGRHGADPASMTARSRFDPGAATPTGDGAECGVTADAPSRVAVPEQRAMCDHICLLDAGHVDRGEPHFYGYELPSPRNPGRAVGVYPENGEGPSE